MKQNQDGPVTRAHSNRRSGFGIPAVFAVLAAAAVISAAAVGVAYSSHAASSQTTGTDLSAGTRPHAAAAAITRTAGDSFVNSWDPINPEVNLRECSHLPPYQDPTCGVADYLQTGERVVMRCWEDGHAPDGQTPPPGRNWSSPRWFYVNEVDGPHPGYSGYIYSDLIPVDRQVLTPACTLQILDQYQMPRYVPPPTPKFAVIGSCTTAGGTLTSVSSNFTPGAKYWIDARYPDGATYPLSKPSGTVRPDGSVVWLWPCAGDPAGTYTTMITDYGTGQATDWISFIIGTAQQGGSSGSGGAPTSAAPPNGGGGSGGGNGGPGTPSAPVSTPPAPVPVLYTEQEGHHGVNTFTDPNNASGLGQKIAPAQYVQVSCKLYDPSIGSVSPDGYWYRIASTPWNNAYYSPANTFMNGDPWNGPYTHNTDFNVPDC